MSKHLQARIIALVLAASAAATLAVPAGAQELQQLTGTVSTGYELLNEGGGAYRSPFFGISANLGGFWLNPRVFTFDVQPDLVFGQHFLGPVYSQTGKGVAAHATLLGGSKMPLSITYARRNLKSPTFLGELEQYRGVTTAQQQFGIDWSTHFDRWPSLAVHYSRDGDTVSVPWELAQTYHTANQNLEISSSYRFAKWDLEGRFGNHTASNPLLSGLTTGVASPEDRSHDRQYSFSVSRPLPWRSKLDLDASHQRYDLRSVGKDYNTSYTRMVANLRSELTDRVTVGFNSAYLSNLGDYSRQLILSGFANTGNTNLIITDVSTLTTGGNVQVKIMKGLIAHGEAHTIQGLSNLTDQFDPGGRGFGGGVSYSRQLWGGQLASNYAFTTSTTRGQLEQRAQRNNVGGSYSRILPGAFRMTSSAYLNKGQIRYGFIYPLDAMGTAVELSRNVGAGWNLTGRFELQRNTNAFPADTRSFTKGFGASLSSRRLQVSVAQHFDSGSAYRFGSSIIPIPVGSVVMAADEIPPLVLTNGDSTTLGFMYQPFRKLTLRGQWARYQRDLSSGDMSAMRNLDVRADYDFRKLRFIAGYLRRAQESGNTITSTWLGQQFYVQVNRSFRIF